MSEREVTEAEYDAEFGPTTGVGTTKLGEVSQGQYDAAFGGGPALDSLESFDRNVDDFKRVGLPADIAEKAAHALAGGTYGSFEEAAIMSAPLAKAKGSAITQVDTAALAEVLQERRAQA